MKRKTISLFVMLALIINLCACGTENAAQTEKSAAFKPSMDKTAKADVKIVGIPDNFEALEAVIKDFNAIYPNVNVTYAKIDDYPNNMPKLVLSDDPPEIFMSYRSYFQGNAELTNAMLDMTDMDLDTTILDKGTASSCSYDGKMLRIPLMLNYQGAAVNTTLLKNAGLDIPKTYNEFINACDTLKAKGYTPLQGFANNFYPNFLYNEWRIRLSREDKSGSAFAAMNKAADGSGEYLRKSFATLADYRDKGYFSDELNNTIKDSYDKAILHFFEGDTPFLICSSETLSGMKKRETKSQKFTEKPFSYEFCILPVTDLGMTATEDVWNAFSIAKNSGGVQWAKEFIRFLFTVDELNKMAEVKGLPTAVAKGNGNALYTNLSAVSDENKISSANININTAVSSTYNALAIGVCEGKYTVDEAVSRFPTDVRSLLK